MDVLDCRKASPDRKADDGRIDQKGDPVARNEVDNDCTFEDFLDDRGDVTRQDCGIEIKERAEFTVDEKACDCCQTAGHDQGRHHAQLNQLEAVEEDQRKQESEDRQQPDQDPETGVHDWHAQESTGS